MSRIKHIIEKMTLKQRLIILIILVILLPVLVSSYTTIIYSKNIIQEESVVMAKNTVNQISQNIDTMLEGNVDSISRMLMYDNRLYEFMVNKKDYSGHQKAIDEVLLSGTVLTQYVSTYDEIKIAALLGANGQFFNITFPPADSSAVIRKVKEMADIPKEQNFVIKWHPLQDNFFSNTPSRNVREQNIIVATRAIFQPATGEYLGIIIFAIYEKAIFSKYSSVQLGETGEISIVDKEGNLISHGNETKIRESNLDNDLIKRVLASNGNHFFINKDGQQMLVVTSKSEMNDWITIGTVPLNEISGKVNKVYSIVFLIMFISFVAAGTVVAFLADGIVKPIRKIIRAMEKVEGGDLTVRVNIQGQYEVSNLAQYFNSMISRINQLIEEEYKLEKRKKEAELYALMAQINPHFLYNTLESMVWKAQSMGAYEISSMASALGRLFRISVNKGNVTISVNEELEHVKCYID
ncbi:MAG TPA: histidine kinase, partial [Bacilli bacterium]